MNKEMEERRELEKLELNKLRKFGIDGYIHFLSEEGIVSVDTKLSSIELRWIADSLDRILAKCPTEEKGTIRKK